jgi:hypothetical protein
MLGQGSDPWIRNPSLEGEQSIKNKKRRKASIFVFHSVAVTGPLDGDGGKEGERTQQTCESPEWILTRFRECRRGLWDVIASGKLTASAHRLVADCFLDRDPNQLVVELLLAGTRRSRAPGWASDLQGYWGLCEGGIHIDCWLSLARCKAWSFCSLILSSPGDNRLCPCSLSRALISASKRAWSSGSGYLLITWFSQ